jgi:uncharacterized protein YeaO (DUF488 family)
MRRITLKRIYEPATSKDGIRVLVDRLWPRGISKANARIDLWLRDIAPSTSLRKWFNHDPARWKTFCGRYRAELKKKDRLLSLLRERAKGEPLTLLYSARDERFNQAVALRTVLMKTSARGS